MKDTLTLVFEAKTLDYIANTLAQRPWLEVQAILADIHKQVQQQQAPGPSTSPQSALNGSGEASPLPVQ